MVRSREILIAALFVGLATWAVASQLSTGGGDDAPAAEVRVLEVGEAVSPDVVLLDLDGRLVRLADRLGPKATVLYSWSTVCGCIPVCDEDIRPLVKTLGTEQGVSWVAVCGESTDEPKRIAAHLETLGAPYDLLLDPTHRLCAPLGFDRAAMIVVLDADGYVRFRGNLTDDLDGPTRNYVAEVLPDIAAGRRASPREPAIVYGCVFSDPLPDCPDAELLEATAGAP